MIFAHILSELVKLDVGVLEKLNQLEVPGMKSQVY